MTAPVVAKGKSDCRRFNFFVERRSAGRAYRDWLFYSDIELRSLMYQAGMAVCKPRPLIDWEEVEFRDVVSELL